MTTEDGVNVAYQVVGDGPRDLVFVPGAISHIEIWWEDPATARFLERLASFARLIIFDKRGVGMSDRFDGAPGPEARIADLTAVMGAAGCKRAALCGLSEGGALAAMFTATFPERVASLVLLGSSVKDWVTAGTEELIGDYRRHYWGSGGSIGVSAPSVAHDKAIRAHAGRIERMAATPASMSATFNLNRTLDVRSILPAVARPTLIIHRDGDLIVSVEHGREAARLIPDARYVELVGTDHLPWYQDPDNILDLIEEFVTGVRAPAKVDRLLATVVFTDIVGSTDLATRLGDQAWRSLLDRHDLIARQVLEQDFGGRLWKHTGDGVLATFDRPSRALASAARLVTDLADLGIDIRVGMHTGEVEVRGDDLSGVGVHLAARIMSLADGGEVLASATVPMLATGSGFVFEDRGPRRLHGIAEPWHIHALMMSGTA